LIARPRRFGASLPDNGARRAGEPGMRILIARLIGGIVMFIWGSVVRLGDCLVVGRRQGVM